MKIKSLGPQLIGICGLVGLALSANTTFAGPEVHESIKIAVKTDDGIDETVNIENMEVGDSELITTESGREVLVSRTEDGLELDIDGKLIEVALPHAGEEGSGHRMMILSGDDEHHFSGDGANFVIIDEDEESLGENVFVKRIYKSAEGDFDMEDLQGMIDMEADGVHVIDVDVDAGDFHEGEDKVIIIKKRVEKRVDSSDSDD